MFTVDAHGTHFRVGSDDPVVEAECRDLLADLVTDESDVRVAVEQRVTLVPDEPAADVYTALVATLNYAVIGGRGGDLMPHAGAVSTAAGAVAVLCAPSGSGKSTLTAALVRRGLSYLTDETTVIDPHSLRVVPFRKPLSLKEGSQHLHAALRPHWAAPGRPWLIPGSAIGSAAVPPGWLEPRLLVFPQFVADRPEATVAAVSPGEAAHLVGQQSSRLRDVDGGPVPALARLARRAPAYRVEFGDAEQAADRVLDLLQAA